MAAEFVGRSQFGRAKDTVESGLGFTLGKLIVQRRPDEALATFESRLNQAGRIVTAALHLVVVVIVLVSYCVSIAKQPGAASKLEPPSMFNESK